MTVPDSEAPFATGSCLPLPPEQEREIVTELLRAADADLKEGDVFCVLTERWWTGWNEYVGLERKTEHFTFSTNQIPLHSASRPGKIDNSALIFDGTNDGNSPTLRRDLQEQEDYRFVPIQVWKKFLEWYGGGPELSRKLIKASSHFKNFIVEVHPLCLHLINARDDSQRIITMSRKASVDELYNTICTVLKLEQSEIRIWDFYRKKRHNLLENFDQTLEDAQLHMDQEVRMQSYMFQIWILVDEMTH